MTSVTYDVAVVLVSYVCLENIHKYTYNVFIKGKIHLFKNTEIVLGNSFLAKWIVFLGLFFMGLFVITLLGYDKQ